MNLQTFMPLHEKAGVERVVEEAHPAKFSNQGLSFFGRGPLPGKALPDLSLRTGRTGKEPENPKPFGYCNGADIVTNGSLDGTMVAIGIMAGVIGIFIAYLKYSKKDIR